jgi:GntR family transcriptional regulator/MocR family aminotransferase
MSNLARPIYGSNDSGQVLGDLHLDGQGPTYEQIYRSIREAILAGRCAAGTRLPSSRWLAADLSVSRTTVVAAYDHLLSEGYVVSRTGSGTFVAPDVSGERPAPSAARGAAQARRPAPPPRLSRFGQRMAAQRPRRVYDALGERGPVAIDFMPCVPDRRALANDAWRKSLGACIQSAGAHEGGYGDPAGEAALRREVADYLGRSRGITCAADDVLIVAGLAQALTLCTRLLVDEGDAVLVEDPHYIGARRTFEVAGADLVAAPVDADGIDLSSLAADELARCRLGYVTPSHQFPTGVVLSLARRQSLLAWAYESGAYLIEDDYDSEFRYGGRPIEAMKSLDEAQRVIYVGSFSKVLDPALRLAYMVPPEPLRALLRETRWLQDWASASLEQQALARFIAAGDFDRHLRRTRTRYGRKRDVLLAALEEQLGDAARVHDSRAGLHVMVELPALPVSATSDLIEEALLQGVALYSAAPYFLREPAKVQLILGFTLPEDEAIERGVAVLGRVLAEAVARRSARTQKG